jgi:MraZ protein
MTGNVGSGAGFLGEYEHALDDKGRLTMPSRFRAAIGDPFILTRGLDNCLFAYSLPVWEGIARQLDALPFTSAAPRGFSRLFFSGASEATFDRQGRFLVPANLRQHAGLEREAVIIGVSTRLEIWRLDRWQEFCARTGPEYQALAENLFRS